jgi:hypothetical protein
MAYIGRPLNAGNLAVQSGTGDGSDTTPIATLDYSVGSSNSIGVYLDGVRQLAGTDFTASGTTLTFTTAPANGVGIDVYFLGLELSIPTPADATVTSAKIVDGAILNADVNASASIALSKLASDPTTKVYSGTFTRDTSTATGNVAYTGIGFQPKAIISFGAVATTDQLSIGIDDGSRRGSVYDASGVSAGTYNISGSITFMPQQTGSIFQFGVINSFDSDGFTIGWTKVGSPSGTATFYYLCIG